MINWKSLVGEKGMFLLSKPFLLVGQVDTRLIALGRDAQGKFAPLGTPQATEPAMTSLLEAEVVSYDEPTNSLTLRYDSPVSLPSAATQQLEVTLDAGTAEYFVKGNRIAVVSGGLAGPDGRPLG